MPWIKKNLALVLAIAGALVLLAGSCFYLYSQIQKSSQLDNELSRASMTLQSLQSQQPHPGTDTLDNLSIVKEQQKKLEQLAAKLESNFSPVPFTLITNDSEFRRYLITSLEELRQKARSSGVALRPDFAFGFTREKDMLRFEEGTLPTLSMQMADIKALCDVLFDVKISELYSIRRASTITNKMAMQMIQKALGTRSDLLSNFQIITNDTSIITPYEVQFRSFTPELEKILKGFALNSNAIVVRTVQVIPSEQEYGYAGAPEDPFAAAYGTDNGGTGSQPMRPRPQPRRTAEDKMRDRYGRSPSDDSQNRMPYQGGGRIRRGQGDDEAQTVLKEQPLEVGLLLNIIRPRKQNNN